MQQKLIAIVATFITSTIVNAQGYDFEVVARNLQRPTGITVFGSRHNRNLAFTQLPTPGIPGSMGGKNTVDVLNLRSGRSTQLAFGEPEPTNIAYEDRGLLYWTCKSAGVIVKFNLRNGNLEPVLTGLEKPSGIAIGGVGEIYFTQLPTPGINGANGGRNSVDVFIQDRMFNLTKGEPEPTDIAANECGDTYWTCKSAGVILTRNNRGKVALVLNNLDKPTGIALDEDSRNLYWTEVPTPGVSGANGGRNKVWRLDLKSGVKTLVHEGDPEPTDIAVANDGTLYWTCSSAGVIVQAKIRH